MAPILPQPMMPSVLPASSTPTKRDFSHFPARVDRSAAGSCAGKREHHGDRMLGRGDRISVGRIHDHDAPLGSGGQVDVIDADPGAADDFEVFCGPPR